MNTERYSRQTLLPSIDTAGQQRLLDSRVAVIGAGGLGSPILLYLAAAGIGTLGIIDSDVIALSNLQRQVLYTTPQIGQSKAQQAQQHLSRLNPDIDLQAHPTRLTIDNVQAILHNYDIIVDATDNFATRLLLDDYCSTHSHPLVHGSVAGFTGQVSIFNTLGAGRYVELFPDTDCCDDEQIVGVIGATAGVVGSIQAAEVIKLCLRQGQPLTQRLLTIDLLHNHYSVFEL